jgi:hypothetical protein
MKPPPTYPVEEGRYIEELEYKVLMLHGVAPDKEDTDSLDQWDTSEGVEAAGTRLLRSMAGCVTSLTSRVATLESLRTGDKNRAERLAIDWQSRLEELEKKNEAFVRDAKSITGLVKQAIQNKASNAVTAAGAGVANDSGEALSQLLTKFKDLEFTIHDPRGLVASLRQDVKNLEDKVDMGGVEFREWRFGSQGDFLQWIRRHHADPPSIKLPSFVRPKILMFSPIFAYFDKNLFHTNIIFFPTDISSSTMNFLMLPTRPQVVSCSLCY